MWQDDLTLPSMVIIRRSRSLGSCCWKISKESQPPVHSNLFVTPGRERARTAQGSRNKGQGVQHGPKVPSWPIRIRYSNCPFVNNDDELLQVVFSPVSQTKSPLTWVRVQQSNSAPAQSTSGHCSPINNFYSFTIIYVCVL